MTRICGTIHPKTKHLRVHYAEDIKEGEHTYAVNLLEISKDDYDEDDFRRLCTASVIAEQWTLTAAHCVDYLHEVFYVWYGIFTDSPLVTKLYTKVLKIFIHPSYRSILYDRNDIVDNDISLLHTHKITLKPYGRISAVDHTTMIGLPVTYVGGGGTKKTGDEQLRPLQVGEATISTCDVTMKEKGVFIMCVSPKCSTKMQRPWYGDSGGPLVHDGKIIGVLSFGTDDNIVMDAYTPTSPYIEWLYGVMHSER